MTYVLAIPLSAKIRERAKGMSEDTDRGNSSSVNYSCGWMEVIVSG